MRYYIGIDVAKFKHTASVLDRDGQVVVEPFDFSNDALGFNHCLSVIKPYIPEGIAGLEDTGHYGENLTEFLMKNKAKVAFFNPHATTHMRLAYNATKNDREDSVTIASALMNPRLYRLAQPKNVDMLEIRQYTRMHHKRKEEMNSYKLQLQKDIDHVFPEFNKLLTVYSKTYFHILETYPSADIIAHTDIRSLRKVLKPESGKGLSVSLTAEKLKEAAAQSVGVKNKAIELDIKHLVSIIKDLQEIIAAIDEKIEEFADQLNPSILTIPGIGKFSAMSIVSELGDISNFKSPKQLVKFAGLNPHVYDSGIYSMPRTRIEKKGSKYLRKTLYQIILPVIMYNPVFKTYYEKKIKQGKSARCAEGHCIRKLLRLIYFLLSTGETFDPALLR